MANLTYKIVGIILMAIICCLPYSCNQKADKNFATSNIVPEIIKVDSTLYFQLDQHFSNHILESKCPGVGIVIVENGKILFEKTYGVKAAGNYSMVDRNSVFRIGSLSKGFAGMLASILVDKGMLALDDPIRKYIPEFTMKAKSADQVLTIHHILSHSSGLTEHAYSNLIDDNNNRQVIYQYLNQLTPRDSTGKSYAYQNAAFSLIEAVIEKVTETTYEKALDNYILSPLDMCQSSCCLEGIIGKDNACVGHQYVGPTVGFKASIIKPHYYNVPSAGGVNSTLEDMSKWLMAIMGYKPTVVSAGARRLCFTPYIDTSNDDKYFNRWPEIYDSHYGLGWRIIRTQNHDLIYHGGLVNGFRAEIAFDEFKNLGIVVLFNSTCSYSNTVVPDFLQYWDTLHDPCHKEIL